MRGQLGKSWKLGEAKRKRWKKRGENGRKAGRVVLEGNSSGGSRANEGNPGYKWERGREVEKGRATVIPGKVRED